LVTWQAAWYK